jgi:hypothetical protein
MMLEVYFVLWSAKTYFGFGTLVICDALSISFSYYGVQYSN